MANIAYGEPLLQNQLTAFARDNNYHAPNFFLRSMAKGNQPGMNVIKQNHLQLAACSNLLDLSPYEITKSPNRIPARSFTGRIIQFSLTDCSYSVCPYFSLYQFCSGTAQSPYASRADLRRPISTKEWSLPSPDDGALYIHQ